MCRRGEDIDVVQVPVMQQVPPGDLTASCPVEMRWKMLPIDMCIAELVRALNASGHSTTSACCGHGEAPGVIGLADGRALLVVETTDGESLGDLATASRYAGARVVYSKDFSMEVAKRDAIVRAMRAAGGNTTEASRLLGVSPKTVRTSMRLVEKEKYDAERERRERYREDRSGEPDK